MLSVWPRRSGARVRSAMPDSSAIASPTPATVRRMLSARSPITYAATPTVTAQEMPPAAFQKTNDRHSMRVMPASHEAQTRRPRIQRPRNTALPPWRSKNGSNVVMTFRRWFSMNPGRSSRRRPPWRATTYPMLSPMIAATAASTITSSMSSLPLPARTPPAISAVSPGTGRPPASAMISRKRTG